MKMDVLNVRLRKFAFQFWPSVFTAEENHLNSLGSVFSSTKW